MKRERNNLAWCLFGGSHEIGQIDIPALWEVARKFEPWNRWSVYEVLAARFNYDGTIKATYAEMAKNEGVSVGRIRQVVEKSLRVMRHPARVAAYLKR